MVEKIFFVTFDASINVDSQNNRLTSMPFKVDLHNLFASYIIIEKIFSFILVKTLIIRMIVLFEILQIKKNDFIDSSIYNARTIIK
ncbi:unnamed protein product [Rotaria magnacalcarata]